MFFCIAVLDMRRDIAEKKDLLDERMMQIENVTQQLQSAEVRRLSDDDGDPITCESTDIYCFHVAHGDRVPHSQFTVSRFAGLSWASHRLL